MDDIPKSHLQNMLELYMTSITITLSIQLSLMLYRKLKGYNCTYKEVEKRTIPIPYHQMPRVRASASSASSSPSSNIPKYRTKRRRQSFPSYDYDDFKIARSRHIHV